MECPACRHENRSGARFCSRCGAALAAACPSCGQESPPGARFCDACGSALGASARGAAAPEAGASGPASGPEAGASGPAPEPPAEGERRQLTVAFWDLADSTEIAARLQSVAAPNAVVLSEATRRLVQGLFVTEDLGPQELKGLAEPVRAHRALRRTGVRSRLDVASGGDGPPLVGRERELGLLVDRWERVVEGEGQVVVVSGEPGIGKSRILQALRAELARAPHTWLEELTKAVLESGAPEKEEEGAAVAVPATLQDSLMAHLDRLSTAREVAQLCAALGREALGMRFLLPQGYAWLAFLLMEQGRLEEAAALNERARGLHSRFSAAEIERQGGELARPRREPEAAGAGFERALALAREQGAHAFELRAATSLARRGGSRGAPPTATPSSRPSTSASPRASTRPTCARRRRCSKSSRRPGSGARPRDSRAMADLVGQYRSEGGGRAGSGGRLAGERIDRGASDSGG